MDNFSPMQTTLGKDLISRRRLSLTICPSSLFMFIANSLKQHPKLRALWLGAVKQATKVRVCIVCFRKVKDTED